MFTWNALVSRGSVEFFFFFAYGLVYLFTFTHTYLGRVRRSYGGSFNPRMAAIGIRLNRFDGSYPALFYGPRIPLTVYYSNALEVLFYFHLKRRYSFYLDDPPFGVFILVIHYSQFFNESPGL